MTSSDLYTPPRVPPTTQKTSPLFEEGVAAAYLSENLDTGERSLRLYGGRFDFYVIEMDDPPTRTCQIFLGWPFMRTESTKIDVNAGTLSMEIEGEAKVGFNIYEVIIETYELTSSLGCKDFKISSAMGRHP